MLKQKVNIVWLRRDLRLHDNTALLKALGQKVPILLLFVFDDDILNRLEKNDSRVTFIYDILKKIDSDLKLFNSALLAKKGKVLDTFQSLFQQYQVNAVFANEDYEPYGIRRDAEVANLCGQFNVEFHLFKDHVIFAKTEIVKKDGLPYTVFTPYKKQWLKNFELLDIEVNHFNITNYACIKHEFPSLQSIGFSRGKFLVKDYSFKQLNEYHKQRDYPIKNIGSYLGLHLRFGTISVRQAVKEAAGSSETFLSELIWREFFMQILYHFPNSVSESFKSDFRFIKWLNNEEEFARWCEGKTGFPMVDAGMRQLNQTGYMHNRVRMVTASFLCKHLLIDWRWGEAYFASKLLDFELSSNVGNWQWAASTGCDAVPYFRIFNPELQQQRFDPTFEYIENWVPEYRTKDYPEPIVDHKMARDRAISTFKSQKEK